LKLQFSRIKIRLLFSNETLFLIRDRSHPSSRPVDGTEGTMCMGCPSFCACLLCVAPSAPVWWMHSTTCCRQFICLFLTHRATKLVAALLTVAEVTAGLAESNGSLPPGLWITSPAGWLQRTGISSGTIRSVIEYGLPLPFLFLTNFLHVHTNCS